MRAQTFEVTSWKEEGGISVSLQVNFFVVNDLFCFVSFCFFPFEALVLVMRS